MKFTASVFAILVAVTGALAAPGGGKPSKPSKPAPKPPVIQQNNCGQGQSLYCCNAEGKDSDVTCKTFSNGGIGGICNGIQACCNNNEGSQSCSFAVGGGTIIIIEDDKKKGGW